MAAMESVERHKPLAAGVDVTCDKISELQSSALESPV